MGIQAEEWQRMEPRQMSAYKYEASFHLLHEQSESTTVNKGMTCFIQDTFSHPYFSFVSSCMRRKEREKGNQVLKALFCEWELKAAQEFQTQEQSKVVSLVLYYLSYIDAAPHREGRDVPGGAQVSAGPLPSTLAALPHTSDPGTPSVCASPGLLRVFTKEMILILLFSFLSGGLYSFPRL